MQAVRLSLRHIRSSVRPAALVLFLFFFYGVSVSAWAQLKVVVSQVSQAGVYPNGGSIDGGEPAGSTMAVNQQGQVIFGNTYVNDVLELNPATGAVKVLGSYSNVGATAVDAQNSYYFTGLYGPPIVKIPYVNGAYAAFNASPTASCTGNDTAACTVPGLTVAANGYYPGVSALTFDAAGDLFFGVQNSGTGANGIFECTAACTTGNGSAVLLYQEPTSTTAQLVLGSMATDANGDLFFTDSAQASSGSTGSNLKELVYTPGTGFAATPLTLYAFTPTIAGDQLDAVNVANGTVYFSTSSDGIFAMPVSAAGVVNTAAVYAVSTQGAKVMATDGKGNFFADVSTTGNDAIDQIAVGMVTAPSTTVGSSAQVTDVTTILNDATCAVSPTVSYVSTTTEFSAATTGACTSVAAVTTGGSFATTVTFTPASAGTRTATLTATDSTGGTGTANLTGVGTASTVATPTFSPLGGTFTTIQTVAISDTTAGATIYYTTDGTTPTIGSTMYTGPVTVAASETIQAIAAETGENTSGVGSAVYTINLPAAATPTFSPAGGIFTTSQSVMISDTTAGATIYYTTNGTTPTTSSAVYGGPITVAASETVNAIAEATGYSASAVGSAQFVINSAPTNTPLQVVVSQVSQAGVYPTAAGGLAGGEPSGSTMAVNQQGQVIFSNTYGNDVLELNPATGAVTVLGAPGNPGATAVDAQNNYYFTNLYQTAIVKIPYVNGAYAAFNAAPTANCTGNDTAACLVPDLANGTNGYYFGVLSLTFDSAGDLFFGLTNGNTAPNAIFECTAACTTGNGSAVLLYQEPTSTTAQLVLGSMATDANGDLFFTDSAQASSGPTGSNLKELVYTPGTGFAATPLTLYAFTPTIAGDQLDAVNVANGTVYFSTSSDGIFAMPVSAAGVVNTAAVYAVSTQGAKVMATDGKGNFFADVSTTGNDAIDQIAVGMVTAPSTTVGSSTQVTDVTTILNDATCAVSPTVSYVSTTTEFSAATTGACTSVAAVTTGGSFATTVTFTPASAGTRTSTLTATDSTGGTGTANLTGVGTTEPAAATPTFSVAAGTYTSVQTVTISDTTSGAAIYYTLDGSTPTANSTLYSAPISVSSSETVTAIATASGYVPSAVASEAYVINLPAAPAPTFSPAAGTYTSAQTVTLTDAATSSTIYYTVDGSTPTTSSMVYSAPISVTATETINAIATASGYSTSAVGTALYTINYPPAATPVFSPVGGTYTSAQSVTIVDTTAGATIYYTTNGSTPTTSSAVYSGAITVSANETIEAIATASGASTSAVGMAAYVINLPAAAPTISPAAGTYNSTQTVTMADTTAGATIYYTTNGSTPTTSSTVYSGAFPVPVSETVEAIAIAPGYSASPVTSAAFTITQAAATPLFSVPGGAYTSTQMVSITDGTPGAAIYYTVDGTTPTSASMSYTGPIYVGASETLNAIAIAAGFNSSAVATAAYVINLPAQSFTLATNPGTLTLTPGASGTLVVTLTPQNGFTSNVTFACTGLPAVAGCTFSPEIVAPTGAGAISTNLTVSTTTASASRSQGPRIWIPGASFAGALLCLLGFGRRRRLRALLLLLISAAGVGMISGCGSGKPTQAAPAATTSTVTITGTAGSLQSTTTFTLTVQ
jgi:hypothetical protein